ncbi:MAG: hypothetical protein ACE5OZ_10995 [Candidatus Heimdallarchaeota archaeon]
MSPLLGESVIISLVLAAWLIFLIFTVLMLSYMVLESWGHLWDLLWRGLVLIVIIPPGVVVFTVYFWFLISPFFYNMSEDQKQLVVAIYIVFVLLVSIAGQFLYVRMTVLDGMRQRNLTFLEYFRYRLRAGRVIAEEKEKKLDARLRADVMIEKMASVKPAAFVSTTPSKPTKGPKLDVHGKFPAFNIRWNFILPLSCSEVILFFILLWVGPLFLLWSGEPLDTLSTHPGFGTFGDWFSQFIEVFFLPVWGTMVFLFVIGARTDIRMSETPLLVIAAPLVSIPLFFYSVHFLLGYHTLGTITFIALLSIMVFISSAVPVLFFFAIFFGAGIGDWLFTGTTVRRFASRGQTVFLVAICAAAVIAIFQLNSLLFPPEMEQATVMVESILLVSIILGLAKIPLDEKLIVSVVAPILAVLVTLFLASPVNLMFWLILILPLFAYFADTLDLDGTKIRIKVVIISVTLLFFLAEGLYIFIYYFVSDQAFAISLLAIASSTVYLTIKLHLEPEEGLIISPIVTIGFIATLLANQLLPRFEQLDDIMLGTLPLPFFLLLALSVLLGRVMRQNVLFIADDGHKLANKGERVLDDWMNRHHLDHSIHPTLSDDIQVSFCVKCKNKEYLIQFWPKFRKSEDMAKFHLFEQKIERNKIEIDLVHPNSLDFLDSRLDYILKGENRTSKGDMLSYW